MVNGFDRARKELNDALYEMERKRYPKKTRELLNSILYDLGDVQKQVGIYEEKKRSK